MASKKKPKAGSDSQTAKIAANLHAARLAAGMTLEQLAAESKISKTYLWELENDEEGLKKPSADILLKIARVLDTTIADLLGLPSVQVNEKKVEISQSLAEFRDFMKSMGTPLKDDDIQALAMTRFRGGQPRTKEGWFDLYETLKRSTGRQ
ncbi:anaerobic benzoate catabolism transcriptional regulator [Crateriforma conspicua]|uniref:Anaerobic benzoate catabolism transcriptional regulator n=1 Tax=Crateriforma conspicua TaxID=2527996 RepID=A0A5C6FQ54_9PLAN|nr:helix-turn-helix transcriptional regulator [Crateriforma conspicua]TWU64531.1 anaerobic benzoate catabolism transcriptional regulator [Crateriforma conspicua]